MLLSVEHWRGVLLASEPEEAAQRIVSKLIGYGMPRDTLTRESDVKQLANACGLGASGETPLAATISNACPPPPAASIKGTIADARLAWLMRVRQIYLMGR